MTSGKIWRRGRRRKRVQTCFLPKTPPPPQLSFFFPLPLFLSPEVYETKRKKCPSIHPPLPTPPNGRETPHPSSLLSIWLWWGTARGSLQKKKKNLLGWLVGSFLFRIASSIIVTFFFLMFWWFGVLSSNCSFAFFVHLQLSWYSVYTGSFSQCSDFLRFCDFCEFVEKNKQEKKKLQGMFCVAYELWLIANVENIGDVLVPVWSLYDRLVDILHLRERRSDGSVSKSFERDISKSFEP